MQQIEQTAGWDGAERKRVAAVVETLATVRGGGDNLAELAHDARNMVTALGLYCDLLEEPGVLAIPYAHYGNELRLVASASRRLVQKLVALDTRETPQTAPAWGSARVAARFSDRTAFAEQSRPEQRWDITPAVFIDNFAEELLANRNLLAALAGPAIALTVDTEGGALPVGVTGEDLTRILVNLVKNAAEAMPRGGRIQLSLRELATDSGAREGLSLTIDDSGKGIPQNALERVFDAGFSTQPTGSSNEGWPAAHRGLGLSITRSIVEAAGGGIRAANRSPSGASIRIELPIRQR